MQNTPANAQDNNHDYRNISQIIQLFNQAAPEAKNLTTLAAHIGLSPMQVQKLFSRWAGISPKRFAQYLTVKDIKARLNEKPCLLDLSLDVGLSSTSHDHFIQFYAMSPKQVREQGAGLTISHGFYTSPFGQCHIASTDKGICWLAFTEPVSEQNALEQLKQEWPYASLRRDDQDSYHQRIIDSIFDTTHAQQPLFLHIKGSNFQLRVQEALLKIPAGQCCQYQDVAQLIGASRAARAVGTAIGKNPISWLIPCHRVIRATGVIGHYRWGQTRKQSLLAWEQGQFNQR